MKRILISASDPGAANALFPLVSQLRSDDFLLDIVLSKEAKVIFNNQKIKFIDGDKMNTRELTGILARNYDIYLSGSSIGNTLDKKLLEYVKLKGVTSVCLLDYWTYYWQRFSKNYKDFYFIPDYILVMDKRAKKEMVAQGFNPKTLVVTGNPYFEYFLSRIYEKAENQTIIFISQPLSAMPDYNTNLYRGYDEFEVLQDVIEALREIGKDYELKICLHPKEKNNKYNKYLDNKNVHIDRDPLETSISSAGLVIGMTSIVLFLSSAAGKTVLSYQPKLKKKYRLDTNSKIVGRLITSKQDLKLYLKSYFKYTHANFKRVVNTTYKIEKGSTENIVKFLSKLTK